MTQRQRIQATCCVVSFAAAVAAGTAHLAYEHMPNIVPLVFAWLSGAMWMGVFVFHHNGEERKD